MLVIDAGGALRSAEGGLVVAVPLGQPKEQFHRSGLSRPQLAKWWQWILAGQSQQALSGQGAE